MTWQQAWAEHRTPWDAGASAPILTSLVEQQRFPDGRVLVPGCGSGYDVLTLASAHRQAVGLDLAEGAQARFCALRDAAGVPGEWAQVRVADFFNFEPDAPFDAAWDYTFLCAIEPSRRPEWARSMHRLLKEDGELITLVFPVRSIEELPAPDADGPPYPLHPDLVADLVEDYFELISLEAVEHSHPGREGMEWLARWRPRR